MKSFSAPTAFYMQTAAQYINRFLVFTIFTHFSVYL